MSFDWPGNGSPSVGAYSKVGGAVQVSGCFAKITSALLISHGRYDESCCRTSLGGRCGSQRNVNSVEWPASSAAIGLLAALVTSQSQTSGADRHVPPPSPPPSPPSSPQESAGVCAVRAIDDRRRVEIVGCGPDKDGALKSFCLAFSECLGARNAGHFPPFQVGRKGRRFCSLFFKCCD